MHCNQRVALVPASRETLCATKTQHRQKKKRERKYGGLRTREKDKRKKKPKLICCVLILAANQSAKWHGAQFGKSCQLEQITGVKLTAKARNSLNSFFSLSWFLGVEKERTVILAALQRPKLNWNQYHKARICQLWGGPWSIVFSKGVPNSSWSW